MADTPGRKKRRPGCAFHWQEHGGHRHGCFRKADRAHRWHKCSCGATLRNAQACSDSSDSSPAGSTTRGG